MTLCLQFANIAGILMKFNIDISEILRCEICRILWVVSHCAAVIVVLCCSSNSSLLAEIVFDVAESGVKFRGRVQISKRKSFVTQSTVVFVVLAAPLSDRFVCGHLAPSIAARVTKVSCVMSATSEPQVRLSQASPLRDAERPRPP